VVGEKNKLTHGLVVVIAHDAAVAGVAGDEEGECTLVSEELCHLFFEVDLPEGVCPKFRCVVADVLIGEIQVEGKLGDAVKLFGVLPSFDLARGARTRTARRGYCHPRRGDRAAWISPAGRRR
jgi:hypothetical protein